MSERRMNPLMIGCLVLLVIGIGITVFVVMNFKSLATNMIRQGIKETLAQSDLSEDQRRRIDQQIDLISNDFENGVLSMEDVQALGEELAPMLHFATSIYAIQQYVEPSGLPEEEKIEARRHIRRFARAAYEQRVSQEELDNSIRPIRKYPDQEGNYELRESISDSDLRRLVADLETRANDLNMPAEVEDPDYAGDIEAAVERVYRNAGLEVPATAAPSGAETPPDGDDGSDTGETDAGGGDSSSTPDDSGDTPK